MAKKQMSFAEKAAKHKSSKDWKTVKYVKSERSDKTGSWRFNESYIQLASNENLDQALSRMEQDIKDLAKEMATIESTSAEKENKKEVKAEETATSEEVKTEEAKPEKKINPVAKVETEEVEPKKASQEV
jgi:hypothetical protein